MTASLCGLVNLETRTQQFAGRQIAWREGARSVVGSVAGSGVSPHQAAEGGSAMAEKLVTPLVLRGLL